MKKIFLVFLLVFFCHSLIMAQTFLVKCDGQVIKFLKYKLKDGLVIVTSPFQKEKLKFDIDEVKGYYSLLTNTMYYNKPSINGFIERIVDGKINVYTETVVSSYATGVDVYMKQTDYLYLEKDGEFLNILRSGIKSKKEKEAKLNMLQELVKDDLYLSKEVDANHFKFNKKNIIRVVNEYNLRAYRPPDKLSENMSRVVFFRRKRGPYHGATWLFIGQTKYRINENSKIEIEIPYDQHVKVCAGNTPTETTCVLISGSKYFIESYEVSIDKDEVPQIKKKGKDYTEFYTSKMR